MAINPAALLKHARARKAFEQRHPKAVAFANEEMGSNLPVGTVMTITLEKPGEPPKTTNLRMTEEDVELFRLIDQLEF